MHFHCSMYVESFHGNKSKNNIIHTLEEMIRIMNFFSQFYLNHYFHLCQLEIESGNFIMCKCWRNLISCSLKLGFEIRRPLKTQLAGPSRLSVRKYKVWRNFICIISFNLQPQPYYIQRNGFSKVKWIERYRIRSLSSWQCRKKTKATIDLSRYSDLGWQMHEASGY